MRILLSVIMIGLCLNCKAQEKLQVTSSKTQETNVELKSKLVVAIVVDQMRYDYLTRFADKYSEGGFKRMIQEGFNCKNNHFNYIPTKTAAGHASIFTGTTPKYHGIIANSWFDKSSKDYVYCTGDANMTSIGTESDAGQMSPHRMIATSFADENRLFTQSRGKTIGISIKDRGAILPAGHTANAAYWFHGLDAGHFITSSFYMKSLPSWVQDFNASDIAESYLKVWNTLYPIASYTESGADLTSFEGGFKGKNTPTFPYDLGLLKSENKGFSILKSTAYGNSLTTDFALAAIDGEQLGQDNHTDVLTISYSSTDYVGHNFGVNSKEIQDTYLRLDKDLERLFLALDKKVGVGQYTVMLTADHGAPETPAYLKSLKVPSGLFDYRKAKKELNTLLFEKYKTSDVILSISNAQLFLDQKKIEQSNLDKHQIQDLLIDKLLGYKLVEKVYKANTMHNTGFSDGIELLLSNGYNQKRSGDLLIVLHPTVLADVKWNKTGTDHGSGYSYDTHVPLLFFGNGIREGSTLLKTNASDIAPTISALLGISYPNAVTGQPLHFVLD